MAQSKQKYHLHLKGYVGGYDFDSDYVDYILAKYPDSEVNVLIDSLGGSLATALSIVAAFRNHGNVHVHFVGMNASAATIASMGAKRITMDSSAMYLVHKCSVEFFQWASANSDKLAEIIKETRQMKSDLEKMDANVAQLYGFEYPLYSHLLNRFINSLLSFPPHNASLPFLREFPASLKNSSELDSSLT